MSQAVSLADTDTPVIETLRTLLQTRGEEVATWMDARRIESGAPFYSSVDLRHAGFKLAPVDTNLFPAGFNKLSKASRERASQRAKARFVRYEKPICRILIIPENHTRNQGYIDNLAALVSVLEGAGAEVHLGSLAAPLGHPVEVVASDGTMLFQYPMKRQGSMLLTEEGFIPQMIVLNNDLTSGFPDILRGVVQPIAPRPSQGWHRRRKSIYFDAYDKLAKDFASAFQIDPWLISSESHKCGLVNFSERQGLECVAVGVEKVLHKVRAHYQRYGITDEPYVYVKSDAGTYGMGIMTVRSGDEMLELNKKLRNKMNVIKEGVQSTEVVIQEGIPTIDVIDGAPGEPMMYLVDGHAVGGAYRINRERDAHNNLNATGMEFVGMCDESEEGKAKMRQCQFGALGLIAELASLAAPLEEYGEGYSI